MNIVNISTLENISFFWLYKADASGSLNKGLIDWLIEF